MVYSWNSSYRKSTARTDSSMADSFWRISRTDVITHSLIYTLHSFIVSQLFLVYSLLIMLCFCFQYQVTMLYYYVIRNNFAFCTLLDLITKTATAAAVANEFIAFNELFQFFPRWMYKGSDGICAFLNTTIISIRGVYEYWDIYFTANRSVKPTNKNKMSMQSIEHGQKREGKCCLSRCCMDFGLQ